MKHFKITVCALAMAGAVAAPATAEHGPDWKVYSPYQDAIDGEKVACFYEAKTISENEDGSVLVLTKCLSHKHLNQDSHAALDAVIKLDDGYMPPLSKIPEYAKLNRNQWGLLIQYEVIANTRKITARSTEQNNINCTKRTAHISQIIIDRVPQDETVDMTSVAANSLYNNLITLACPTPAAAPMPFASVATKSDIIGRASVIDGDTIEIHGRRIRLHGIDAPEKGQPCFDASGKPWRCGPAAANALDEFIGVSPVACHERDVDRYGRVVATCTVRGEDIEAWLVRNGHAMAYRKYSSDYIAAEQEAKNAKRGIWSGVMRSPWEWRAERRSGQRESAQ